MNAIRRTLLPIAAGLLLLAPIISAAGGTPGTSTALQAAIIIDASGSYRSRLREAIAQVIALLEQLASTEVKRWEKGRDRVSIVSLDAVPEVLFEGDLEALKAVDAGSWSDRFASRADYAGCTDVSAAFRVAAGRLDGDAQAVAKYLFVFSDLVDEPPTTAVDVCREPQRPSPPPAGFPWELLEDVSVSVMWLPKDQKLSWHRAINERGLGESFRLYTDSESSSPAGVALAAKRRKVDWTDSQREVARQSVKSGARHALGWAATAAAGLFGICVLGIGLLLALSKLRRRRSRRARPAATAVARPRPALRPGPRPTPPEAH
ncbi:MAG: VWA domain-containing protein [Deltaproteobacteria bacterium]|nr:VWA domain-containing protein [Deltaproteobacteria bacterium]